MVKIYQIPESWNRFLNSLVGRFTGKDRKMKIADGTFIMLYMPEITLFGMK
jgi:hypothetical protein